MKPKQMCLGYPKEVTAQHLQFRDYVVTILTFLHNIGKLLF